MIELKIDTYGCECGYHMPASIDPYTDAFVARYKGRVQKGGCPSCATHPDPQQRKHSQLSKIVDLSQMTTTRTAEQEDIDAESTLDTDAQGTPLLEKVGDRFRLNTQTGKIEPVAVNRAKERPLKTNEKAEKMEQAQRDLDRLAKLEHKAS